MIFASLVVAVFCAGAFATTDIQPNGNLSGGNTAANCTQPVLGTYSGSTNFEAKWRANTVPLRWYNQGAKLTVQDAANTCTYDGTLTIPSTAPSRTGYTFGGWKVVSLPKGYTELQYIGLSGGQYINTGIVLTDPTNIEQAFWVQFNESSLSTFQTLFGFMASGTSPRYGVNVYTGRWMLGINTTTSSGTTVSSSAYQLVFTTTQNTQTLTDGSGNVLVSTSLSSNAFVGNTLQAYFGARNNYGSVVNQVYGKLGKSYLKQNGVFLYNYIPAKRDSDNVVGMYDTMSGTFFTNAGTGSFTAGPAVN